MPPKTPTEIINILYQACANVNADPEFAQKMVEMGFLIENLGPEASAKLIDRLTVEYSALIDELN